MRYMERNAKKAGLCRLAQDWRPSSIWQRENGSVEQAAILAEWSVLETDEGKIIDATIEKGNPYGNSDWMEKVVKKFGL